MTRHFRALRHSQWLMTAGLAWTLTAIPNMAVSDEPARSELPPAIERILTARCVECHGEEDPEARLDLTTLESLLIGGETGRSVLPGDPEESLLWQKIVTGEMPPDGEPALSDDEQQAIRHWIVTGPFPSNQDIERAERARLTTAARRHWAFRPVHDPVVPLVQDRVWPRTPIDRFVLSRLEQNRLRPVRDADGYTLLRRAYYDLTGLPPSPEDVAAFIRDFRRDSQTAVESVIDRLLASPHFGDRWGRHWLDVARYSDTLGGGSNYTLDDAWRYRDYVIDAFNSDLPYDRFVTEQIAGDLLPFDTALEHERQLIATGFLSLGPKDFTDQDKVKLLADVIDEQMNTLSKAFMGLSVGCARCHSHKFDPIPVEDYYALAGIFRSTQTLEELDDTRKFANMPSWNHIPLPTMTASERQKIEEAWQTRTESLRKQKQQLTRKLKQLTENKTQMPATPDAQMESAALEAAVADLEQAIKGRVALKNYFGTPTLPTILGVLNGDRIENARVNPGGDPRRFGHEVPRGVLRAFGRSVHIPEQVSGRLQLAQWLIDPQHPLTARVMVNRVWSHLLGHGIVSSPDNFGTSGDPPSHPELLDYLAVRFVEDGWSVKSLIRRIMRSRIYQLASAHNHAAEQVDPENRLLWKRTTRRMDVEAIRDSLLQIGGLLSGVRGGPTLVHTGELSLNYREDVPRDNVWKRRSVYLPVYRNTILRQTAMHATFDFADPNLVVGRRVSSIVPTQALFLMNNDLSLECSSSLARRLFHCESDDGRRVCRAYAAVLGRPPSRHEIRRALDFIQTAVDRARDMEDPQQIAWTGFCQTLFSSGEFLLLN